MEWHLGAVRELVESDGCPLALRIPCGFERCADARFLLLPSLRRWDDPLSEPVAFGGIGLLPSELESWHVACLWSRPLVGVLLVGPVWGA